MGLGPAEPTTVAIKGLQVISSTEIYGGNDPQRLDGCALWRGIDRGKERIIGKNGAPGRRSSLETAASGAEADRDAEDTTTTADFSLCLPYVVVLVAPRAGCVVGHSDARVGGSASPRLAF